MEIAIEKILKNKIDEILNRKPKQKFIWNDSIFEDLKIYLSIDERWQLWEELINDILKDKSWFNVIFDPSVTDAIKWYDIIVNNKKIEIKTATITSNSWWFQHEHLEAQRDYHYIFFLDISPNRVFWTLVRKEDIIWTKKRLDWKTKSALHRRPNWDYKCDFTIKHILNNNIPKFRNFITKELKVENDLIELFKNI